jgi:hypothetical protein
MPTYQEIIKGLGLLVGSVIVLSLSLLLVYSIIGYLGSSKSEPVSPTCPEPTCRVCPIVRECPIIRCPSCPSCPDCPLYPESPMPQRL